MTPVVVKVLSGGPCKLLPVSDRSRVLSVLTRTGSRGVLPVETGQPSSRHLLVATNQTGRKLLPVIQIPGVGAPGPAGPPGSGSGGSSQALQAHIVNENPHPDAQSGRNFAALFQNGLI